MQYSGGVQFRGGYHDACGGYLEYCVLWRMFSTVVGYHDARGGYFADFRGIHFHNSCSLNNMPLYEEIFAEHKLK